MVDPLRTRGARVGIDPGAAPARGGRARPSRVAPLLVGLLLGLLVLGACSPGPRGPGWQARGRAWFDAEVLTGMGEKGQPVATLAVSVPYRNLVFFQRDDGFHASYRVRALQRIRGEAQRLGEWKGEVQVADYAQTRRSLVARKTITLDLAPVPGEKPEFQLEVRVEVEGTTRVGSTVLALEPRRFREGGLTLGELALYRRRDLKFEPPTHLEVMGHAVPDPQNFQRQNSRTFDLATGEPWLLLRVFDLREESARGEHPVDVRVFEGESGGREVWSREVMAPSEGTETGVFLRLPPDAFAFGTNRIRVSRPGAESVELHLDNQGLDLSDGRSWDANLRQVSVLADAAERDRFEEAQPSERQAVWDEFWARRDPDPSTPENERLQEHFQRVSYARTFLQDGFRDGALSDRGQIHILHGKPDTIDDSAPTMDSFVHYEVWRYYKIGLAYYFQDSDGMGQYRLVWRESI